MKNWLLQAVLFASVSCMQLTGQSVSSDLPSASYEGITVHADPRLDQMVERHIRLNKQKRGIDGYRIQIYFNSGPEAREKSNRLKADVLSDYPEVPVYILFQSPFYKVRIGDFRSRAEALGIYYSLKKKFPGAYIVKDIIRFPRLEGDS